MRCKSCAALYVNDILFLYLNARCINWFENIVCRTIIKIFWHQLEFDMVVDDTVQTF